MKIRNYVSISRVHDIHGITRHGYTLTGEAAIDSMKMLGRRPSEYKLTTIPEWLTTQKKLLSKLGVHPSIIKHIDFSKALNKLIMEYPEDVLVIEWHGKRNETFYALAFKRSFEVTGIWSKI